MRFKSTSEDGLLLWRGDSPMRANSDFMSLGLQDGALIFRCEVKNRSHVCFYHEMILTCHCHHTVIIWAAEALLSSLMEPSVTAGGTESKLSGQTYWINLINIMQSIIHNDKNAINSNNNNAIQCKNIIIILFRKVIRPY